MKPLRCCGCWDIVVASGRGNEGLGMGGFAGLGTVE